MLRATARLAQERHCAFGIAVAQGLHPSLVRFGCRLRWNGMRATVSASGDTTKQTGHEGEPSPWCSERVVPPAWRGSRGAAPGP